MKTLLPVSMHLLANLTLAAATPSCAAPAADAPLRTKAYYTRLTANKMRSPNLQVILLAHVASILATF